MGEDSINRKNKVSVKKIEAICTAYVPELECSYFKPLLVKRGSLKECKFSKIGFCFMCSCEEAIKDAVLRQLEKK